MDSCMTTKINNYIEYCCTDDLVDVAAIIIAISIVVPIIVGIIALIIVIYCCMRSKKLRN